MAKKDSGFYVNKAQVLRNFGIDAQPVTEQVVVDVQYNENHLKAVADGNGLSVDEFMTTIDEQAETGEIAYPKAKSTKETITEIKGEDKKLSDKKVSPPKSK